MRKSTPIYLAFILTFWAAPVFAKLSGRLLVDSLKNELNKGQKETDEIKILDELSYLLRTTDPDEGIKYGEMELSLATKLGLNNDIADACSQIGLNYQSKSDYPKALEYFYKSQNYYESTRNILGIGIVYSNIGVIFQAQGDYKKALDYALKALKINEQIKRPANIASDLGNIGVLYMLMKDYNKALEYDKKSLALFQELNDKDAIANNLGNIANVYLEMHDYDQSLDYNIKALKLFEEENDKIGIANTLGNTGNLFLNMYRDTSIALNTDERTYALKHAIEYLSRAIDTSRIIGQLDNIIEFSLGLSEAYELSDNNKDALKYYKSYEALKDSVYSAASKLQIAQLESKELKDRQLLLQKLEILKKRDERVVFISGIVALLAILAFFIRRFYVQRKHNIMLSKEKELHLQRIEKQTNVLADIASMQAHEVRGNVASILGLVRIFNMEDPTDPTNKFVIESVTELTEKLDIAVRDVIKKENEHRITD